MKTTPAEDIYWEGEDDLANEFLEVDGSDTGIGSHLNRFKRQAWNLFSWSTPAPDNEENFTEDEELERNEDNDTEFVEGSGLSDVVETELKEICPDNEFRCDETRCIAADKRCDRVQDCDDAADEIDCSG
ncbi:unnamed protein product, partial [Brenthis ino]